jgi:uncharacterized protein
LPVDITLSILLVSIIQSIFGVGVLLFGTPLLLLLGYDYSSTLLILLPISIGINSLQVFKHYRYIDFDYYKNVLLFSIPFVIIFLILGITTKINISLLIGLLLIVTALKSLSSIHSDSFNFIKKYQKTSLILMGIVHGLTNLGGSLLTAIVHQKQYEKNKIRATIAICYLTFAVFQGITLFFLRERSEIMYFNNIAFMVIAILIFVITERFIYSNIDSSRYNNYFASFLLVSGLLLVQRSF